MRKFVKMWDAAFPTFPWPSWLLIVAGYIGGDAKNVWTFAQWKNAGRRRKLPIWVAAQSGTRNGVTDAWAILAQCYRLKIRRGSPIVIDMETLVDPIYLWAIYGILTFFGYRVWVYGSKDTVFGNPPCDGYWVADFTQIRHMVPGKLVRATQYRTPGPYDTSLVKWWQYLHVLKTW